ncbi:MAG TPA: cytochrome c oxidase subunit 3 [Vicinamibacteria bacterium]|jgi:cytochrome c oxidase subunit 3|nr:cytochrome c oxidase subunit 3 [Vicinamibacteria bacterium]
MPAELLEKAPALSGPGGPGGGGVRAGGEGGPSGEGSAGLLGDPERFGLWAFLGTVSMLFIGFTSAVILRRASGDWRPLPAPSVLWLNTAALLASSATLEAARRRLRAWDARSAQALLGVTGLLGGLFLTGQVMAWRELAARGIFLAFNPHSSFFYLLTGVHGAHLLGGLAWFAVAFLGLRRLTYLPGGDGLRLFATYWHFLDALWVYLLFLLFVL